MNRKTTGISQEQVEAQMQLCAQIQAYWHSRGRTPVAYVETYGCQQNEADSERIRGMLSACGYGFGEGPEGADVVVMNTCAIREHAEQRVFGNLGALSHTKRRHPEQKIFLCGCMAGQPEVEARIRKSFPQVDGVFSTHHLWQFPEILRRVLLSGKRTYYTQDEAGSIAEGLPVRRESDLKAWVSIMYGCNNFCSYCIVPYVRGREVSREPDEIVREAREILTMGYKEILLLGQNVNSYGKGLSKPVTFTDLLRRIESLEGDFRIRFMTSHPKDCTRELIDLIAQSKKICHSIHLPVQSGSDRVLGQMNRHYTREHYLSLIEYARQKMPDVTFTTDIIVGFPGETYEDFLQTVSLCEQVRYQCMFTFIYSPRPGTRAAKMPDPVPYKEKTRWLNELIAVQHRISEEDNRAAEGKVMRVLVEQPARHREGWMSGRCENGMVITFPAEGIAPGQFAQVRITRGLRSEYEGELITQ